MVGRKTTIKDQLKTLLKLKSKSRTFEYVLANRVPNQEANNPEFMKNIETVRIQFSIEKTDL